MVKVSRIKKKNNESGGLNFVKRNYLTILKIIGGVFILYWMIFILTPDVKMSESQQKRINDLNNLIIQKESEQKKLSIEIANFNTQIKILDSNITKIRGEKIIIKEIYHEAVNNVDNYSDAQLDSFLTKRYNYYTR
jgi:septal ring factor EnvC (AmiA/AmiB activator)